MIEAIIEPLNWAPTKLSNTYLVFHNFHDVDVQMYLSLTHCHCSLWPSNFIFLLRGKLQQSAVTSWGYTHSSGIPYHYQTLLWCFTTFIWCGCVYVSVLTVLLLLSSAKLLESFLEIWSMGKPEHSVMVEAIDPFNWTPTSMWSTCKVLDNHHMMVWMYRFLSINELVEVGSHIIIKHIWVI